MRLIIILSLMFGFVMANNWETLRDHCDHNDDKRLDRTEFYCLFLQFDKDYDNYVNEKEFENGWRENGLDYTERAPVFFLETDVTGDYRIGEDDMAYLKTLWDVNGDGTVSEHELEDGWNAFYMDRFNN